MGLKAAFDEIYGASGGKAPRDGFETLSN